MAGKLRALWPLLLVSNLEQSIGFYVDQLDFQLVDEATTAGRRFWCRLEREGLSVMLQQAESEDEPAAGRGRGVTFYFVCEDADAMYAELLARQVKATPPQATYYGMRQVFVPEPDGYELCFESPVPA